MAAIRVHRWRGVAAVTLTSGDIEATFLPELGMAGAALRWQGADLVWFTGGKQRLAAGHTAGIPLLHPWANRLARRRYVAAGVAVDLRRIALPTDQNGLPMHGTVLGDRRWEIAAAATTRRRASVTARLDYGAHPDLLAAFPYPHVINVTAAVDGGGLQVTTSVHPTEGLVPVSFGWHPYLRLPGPRSSWRLRWPACERLALNRSSIPTGARTPQPEEDLPIGDRTFDDGFALRADRRFTLRSGRVRLDLDFDGGYGFTQLWVPSGRPFVCIEPMTAPTDALRTDAYALATPDAPYTAAFTLRPTPA